MNGFKMILHVLFLTKKQSNVRRHVEECRSVFFSPFVHRSGDHAGNLEATLEINVSNINSSIYIVNCTVKSVIYQLL